jgi:hypothetical protein
MTIALERHPRRPTARGATSRTPRPSVVLRPVVLLLLALMFAGGPAQARDLRLATWNLGWHLDTALARTWIQACGQHFSRLGPDQLWRPSPEGTQTG